LLKMNLVFLSAFLCAALVTTSGRAIDDVMVRVITSLQIIFTFTKCFIQCRTRKIMKAISISLMLHISYSTRTFQLEDNQRDQ